MSEISFNNIHKTYAKRSILQGATFTLRSGRCCLLFGPNGAGKSTLQRICAGLEKPDSGRVSSRNCEQTWKRQRHYLQTQCVYLHQQAYMFDGSVVQNLVYALPRTTTKTERQGLINMALHWAGLEAIADSWAKTLSGGERQRVALARAWLRSPRYMLLDEPTNNLDETAKQRTLALLMSLKAQGIALLIASHDTQHFESVTDDWLELRQGKIVSRPSATSYTGNVIPLHKIQQARP
jgi:tungstate transport system ATP-binding protein